MKYATYNPKTGELKIGRLRRTPSGEMARESAISAGTYNEFSQARAYALSRGVADSELKVEREP